MKISVTEDKLNRIYIVNGEVPYSDVLEFGTAIAKVIEQEVIRTVADRITDDICPLIPKLLEKLYNEQTK